METRQRLPRASQEKPTQPFATERSLRSRAGAGQMRGRVGANRGAGRASLFASASAPPRRPSSTDEARCQDFNAAIEFPLGGSIFRRGTGHLICHRIMPRAGPARGHYKLPDISFAGSLRTESFTRGMQRVFRPGVARVTAAQLFANLRIDAPPKPRQIGRDLYRAVVGREQMHHQRRAPAGNHRPRLHPEKILQSRFYPGRLACFIIDAHAASAGDRHEFRRHLVQQSLLLGVQTLAQRLDQSAFSGGGAPILQSSSIRRTTLPVTRERRRHRAPESKIREKSSPRIRPARGNWPPLQARRTSANRRRARPRPGRAPPPPLPTVAAAFSLTVNWSYIIRSTTSTRSDCAFHFASVVSRN